MFFFYIFSSSSPSPPSVFANLTRLVGKKSGAKCLKFDEKIISL